MENNELKVVPLVAYESMLAREDRQQRRMVIIIVLLVLLLAVSNGLWLYFWNSYDYVDDYSIEASQDGEGINIVGAGDVDYGASSKGSGNSETHTP